MKELVDSILSSKNEWYESGQDIMSFDDILKEFPDINYLTPDDQNTFCEYITTAYDIEVLPSLKQGAKFFIKLMTND